MFGNTRPSIQNISFTRGGNGDEESERRPGLRPGVNLRDPAFKQRFEQKYPETRFATHMMPYAYDSVNMIVQAFERGENPAVYLRNIRSYEGTAGVLTKARGEGHFASAPAVWTIASGKPALINR